MSIVGIFSLTRCGNYDRCESTHIPISEFSEFLTMYKAGNDCYSFRGYTWYIHHDRNGFRCIVTDFSFNHLEASNTIKRVFGYN